MPITLRVSKCVERMGTASKYARRRKVSREKELANVLGVYSVYDSKAELYMQPFFAMNSAVAARMFSEVALDQGHTFGKHPSDYSLWKVGEFDQSIGLVEGEKMKELVLNAWEIKPEFTLEGVTDGS